MSDAPSQQDRTAPPPTSEAIDAACDRFERAWQAALAGGTRPRIEDHQAGAPEAEREMLLRELVLLDLHWRSRLGEPLSPEDYRERFPALSERWLRRKVQEQQATIAATPPPPAAAQQETTPPVNRLRCPHCHNPIELGDDGRDEVLCPGCGSSFKVRDARPTSTTDPSRSLGKFQLLERVGVGAFGAVWRARDTELDRIVALKIPHAGLLTADEELQRFQREARAAAQLRHPGIVTVYEVATLEGLPVIVADFVRGASLKELLEARRLTFPETAALLADISEAVHYAHRMGVVHRDLKPANIMLAYEEVLSDAAAGGGKGLGVGRPLVMDFGLALRQGADVTLTTEGAIIGTPAYMSPEQARGQGHAADARSDVYSLGVILYEALCGELPFRGSKLMLLLQVLHDEPKPPRKINDKVPRDLEKICLKCLEKEPRRRYASGEALAEDLRRYLKGEPVQARPAGAVERAIKWTRRRPSVAALLLLVAVVSAAGLGGILWAYGEAVLQWKAARSAEAAAEAKAESARQEKGRAADKAAEALRQAYSAQVGRAEAQLLAGEHVGAQQTLDRIGLEQRGWEHRYLRRRVEGTPCPLRGHTAQVLSVCYSPDGTRLASASEDNTVKVWDARSGTEVTTLRGHTGWVTSVCYSPDGTHLASASRDKTVKVWDARSGTEIATLRGHTSFVTSVCYSPDGSRLASASEDKTVKVWDARSGTEVATLRGHTQSVHSVCYSPDGTHLASASRDKTVKVWDARSGTEVATLRGHTNGVSSVCYSPDGTRLASASWDKTVKVWDARSGIEVATLRGHTLPVLSVCYSPDGTRLASASWDNTVKVWDARSGIEVATLRGHTLPVLSVCYSPDGTRLASASEDNTVKVWDARSGTELATLRGHTLPVLSVCYSPDGTRLASASEDNTVKVWDARSGTELATLRGHTSWVTSVCYSPDRSRLASASEDNTVKVWDARSGTEVATLRGHTQSVHSVCYSPDGTRLASASGDKTVKVWDARSGIEVATLRGHTVGVSSVCYSPDGTRLASASWDNTVKVWDARSGIEVATLRGHTLPVLSVCYSPDGTRLTSASEDNTVKVWDARSGTELATLRGHTSWVTSVCYSPDRSRLASASEDNTVKVWDARSGTELATLRGHTGRLDSVCYSPDGSRLASASHDKTVKVWDARSGTELATLRGHTRGVTSVCYSPDGSRLASASWDNTVKVWDANSGTEVATLCGHTNDVRFVCYSPDGSRILSVEVTGKMLVWDAAAGKLLPDEKPPQCLTISNVSPDGERVAVPDHDVIRIWRRRPAPGEFDPWEEEAARRCVQVPLWHAVEADAAHKRGDAFAAAFHHRRLAEGDNLRMLAWGRLAAGDTNTYLETIRSLRQGHQAAAALAPAGPFFAVFAAGPAPLLAAAPLSPLESEMRRRAALLVRTAALLQDSGIPAPELLALARSCADADPLDWQARELLGAALYRDGKAADAIPVLDQAVRLHGNGGSLWAKLFLALAHQRLGHAEEAETGRKKADQAGPWEEQVIQFHLLHELDAARRPAKP